jgi:hypothetical protein
MPQPPALDDRLAEIDRRLRVIQSGLAPTAEPSPVPPAAEWADRLRAVVEEHERLLASARKLMTDYEAAAAPPSARAAPPGRLPTITVSTPPFAGTDALLRFERALAALPQVRDVTVRQYASGERVILDVDLFEAPIS